VRKSIIALGILGIAKVLFRVEHFVGHLRPNLARIMRRIESRYCPKRGPTRHDVGEEIFMSDAAAGYDAKSGNDNALLLCIESGD
jgi:hypothetical protein